MSKSVIPAILCGKINNFVPINSSDYCIMNDNFAIQLFEGKKVRIVWNEEQEKYYFSVTDIVQVLTDSADVKQYIKRMRARDPELNSRWGTICTPTRMMAADGKIYKTKAAGLEGKSAGCTSRRPDCEKHPR